MVFILDFFPFRNGWHNYDKPQVALFEREQLTNKIEERYVVVFIEYFCFG